MDHFVPEYPGEVPTLGYAVGDWLEENFIVPSGLKAGQPLRLYDEQWEFLLNHYRLHPDAQPFTGAEAFYYSGSLLVGPQKSGKSPLMGMVISAEAIGPTVFAGWDENGRPMGQAHPNPFIQILGSVKEQAQNVILPTTELLKHVEHLVDGLDAGATRIKLPKGTIQFTTSVATSRLGAPLTSVVFTESQLFNESNGLAETARTLVRNVRGMNGRWISDTNPPSPIETSWALQVMESADEDVYIYYRDPKNKPDGSPEIPIIDPDDPLFDPDALTYHIRYVYGSALTSSGGHVPESVIFKEMTRRTTGKGQALRFYGNCMVSLDEDLLHGTTWRDQARSDIVLEDGARVGVGFDGSVTRDCTVLSIFDVDKKTVHVFRSWTRPKDAPEGWKVPIAEVMAAMDEIQERYDVGVVFLDPFYWETQASVWSEKYGNIVDFPTNQQKRFDEAITTFQILFNNGEIFHTDDEILNKHMENSVLKEGNLKMAVGPEGRPVHYKVIKKKKLHHHIDAIIAVILAIQAGLYAQEKDLFSKNKVAEPFMFEL